jgi:hypothetical protein
MLCIHEAIVGATIAAIIPPTAILGRSLRRPKIRAIVGATIAPIHAIPVNQKEAPAHTMT